MATTKTPVRKATKTAVKKAPVKTTSAKPVRAPKTVLKKAATKPVSTPKTAPLKTEKAKKDKLVRDSFTFPKSEYLVLDTLKTRAIQLKQPVKKSELIRAGIKALTAMNDKTFLAALNAVPAIKTGRPQKS